MRQAYRPVSTLLEILAGTSQPRRPDNLPCFSVSTLLEILARTYVISPLEVGEEVSTLLEILGLVCLVVVGF